MRAQNKMTPLLYGMNIKMLFTAIGMAALIASCSIDGAASRKMMSAQDRLPYLVADNLMHTAVDFEVSLSAIGGPDSTAAQMHYYFSNRLQLHLLRALYMRHETDISTDSARALDESISKAVDLLKRHPVTSIWKSGAEANFTTVEPVLPFRFRAYDFLSKHVATAAIRPRE